MLHTWWCFYRFRPSFSTVRSLISAIEQPVSNSVWIWCFFSLWCSTMVITGRVPLVGFLCFFNRVPALGSSFFCFRDALHIIAEVLGCGKSLPFKNPTQSPPIAGLWCRCPLFLPLPLFAVLLWAGFPVLQIISVSSGLRPTLSRELEVRWFLSLS